MFLISFSRGNLTSPEELPGSRRNPPMRSNGIGARNPIETEPLAFPLHARRSVGPEIGVRHGHQEGPVQKLLRDPDAVLDGLASRAEEDALASLEAEQRKDLEGGPLHYTARIAEARVAYARGLLRDGAQHPRVAVPYGGTPDPGLQVDVLPAFGVIKPAVLRSDYVGEKELVARIP
jgi:hypothetical protein